MPVDHPRPGDHDDRCLQPRREPPRRRALRLPLGHPLPDRRPARLRHLVGHERGTEHLAFHPRLGRLASGGVDGDLIQWDIQASRQVRRWLSGGQFVSALAYGPDGSLLATSYSGPVKSPDGRDRTRSARLWDDLTGAERGELPAEEAPIQSLAFDRDGRRIAIGTSSGKLTIRETGTGDPIRSARLRPGVRFVAFLEDGRLLATNGTAGIALIEPEGDAPARAVDMPGGVLRLLADDRRHRLIVAGLDGGLRSFSIDGRRPGSPSRRPITEGSTRSP